jgi:hypothetical protein
MDPWSTEAMVRVWAAPPVPVPALVPPLQAARNVATVRTAARAGSCCFFMCSPSGDSVINREWR